MTEAEFVQKCRELIKSVLAEAKDGLTLAEIGRLFMMFVQFAMETAAEFRLPGGIKKELVMAAVGELYDAVAPFLPLPWFLSPFRGIIAAKLRTIVLAIVSGIIEGVYSRWFVAQKPVPLA